MRRSLAILIGVVILAAVAWGGWWYLQATTRDRALNAWLADRRAAGWVAEVAELRTTGFPNRVDVIATGLSLADPAAGWAWRADEFQVLSLSYRPQEVIAVLPGTQVVSTPYETISASSELFRGSVAFRPTTRLELDRMTFEVEQMQIHGESGWQAGLEKAIFATRQAPTVAPFAHDVALNADQLTLPRSVTGVIDKGGMLPEAINALGIDATVTFDRPWDRSTIEGGNPVVQQVIVRDVSMTWGKLDLRGRGTLDVDADGFAEGRLDMRARNWREMIDLAETTGAVDPTLAGALRAGLGLMARLAGDGEAISVPLDFSDGVTRLGPVVLGPAPVLARRG
jgi:hypothetical protein